MAGLLLAFLFGVGGKGQGLLALRLEAFPLLTQKHAFELGNLLAKPILIFFFDLQALLVIPHCLLLLFQKANKLGFAKLLQTGFHTQNPILYILTTSFFPQIPLPFYRWYRRVCTLRSTRLSDQQLQACPVPVQKDKDFSARGFPAQLTPDQATQPVKALAHIAWSLVEQLLVGKSYM